MQTVSVEYLMGIEEGRNMLEEFGIGKISVKDHIENLCSTIKGFPENTPVGQMLRGERDFWRNQLNIVTK